MSNAVVELTAPFEGRILPGKVATAALADAAVTKPKLGTGFLKMALVNGAAAGNVTVTGIAVADALIGVLHLPDAGAIDAMTDLTPEFTISAANTINNTGGTASTNGKLLVFYQDRA
jgi:hypothetical protein